MVFRTFLPLALLLAPAPSLAQGFVQPLNQTDADRLAEQVRRLGADPRNVDALLTAAELSIRLDDLSAAGAFLARAEKVMPVGGRGAAVRGAILVRSERPGEALRQFAQAEAQGLTPARFAADRGLAYDLIGEQRRAQADYRLALKAGDDAEVRRRLALSLGISGKNKDALDELQPLVRTNDRAAWRARAFILAMGGNATEALGIAQTMMPPGSAQGLRGFFAELPTLPATDRAFAVHFGEVRATPQRLADARLAPQLAPLPAEVAPVQVAAVVPTAQPARDKGRRKKEKVGRVQLAAATPAPVQVAAAEPLPAPPAYRVPAYTPPATQPSVRTPTYTAVDRPLTPGEQASLAAATLRPARSRSRTAPAVTTPASTIPTPSVSRPVEVAVAQPRPAPLVPVTVAAANATRTPPATVQAAPPVQLATAPTSAPTAAALVPTPAASVPDTTAPGFTAPPTAPDATVLASVSPPTTELAASSGSTAPAPEASPGASPEPAAVAPVVAAAPPPAVTPVRVAAAPQPRITRARADDILAKIVANLSVPASELGVAAPAPGTRPSRAARLATRKADSTPDAASADAVSAKLAGKKGADKPEDPQAARLAARKALAEKKAAAEKKELADKAAAEKKAARAEPSRIWVQVAGGANEGDLAKAWKGVQAKAPDAFAGRKGYTTPLRATNRVLTGPFKTDAEARAYVNQLAKKGVSAFAFTSDAGQKVSRLGEK